MAIPLHRRAVTSVHKAYSHDPHERIDTIGGVNSDKTLWSMSQEDAIAAIESRRTEFFVTTREQVVKLVVVTHGGQKYLQSEREKTHPDDLLSMLTR